MNFDELNEHIPLARYGKEKVLSMEPYDGITLAMPGRHAEDTTPRGGDFCVIVASKTRGWKKHQFTHEDLFKDIERRLLSTSAHDRMVMENYLEIITGADPLDIKTHHNGVGKLIEPHIFYCAVQCLAVAEHRRYKQHERKWGGRYLPFRAAAGINEHLWTAQQASERTRKGGRLGVEWLESEYGVPELTKKLMKK